MVVEATQGAPSRRSCSTQGRLDEADREVRPDLRDCTEAHRQRRVLPERTTRTPMAPTRPARQDTDATATIASMAATEGMGLPVHSATIVAVTVVLCVTGLCTGSGMAASINDPQMVSFVEAGRYDLARPGMPLDATSEYFGTFANVVAEPIAVPGISRASRATIWQVQEPDGLLRTTYWYDTKDRLLAFDRDGQRSYAIGDEPPTQAPCYSLVTPDAWTDSGYRFPGGTCRWLTDAHEPRIDTALLAGTANEDGSTMRFDAMRAAWVGPDRRLATPAFSMILHKDASYPWVVQFESPAGGSSGASSQDPQIVSLRLVEYDSSEPPTPSNDRVSEWTPDLRPRQLFGPDERNVTHRFPLSRALHEAAAHPDGQPLAALMETSDVGIIRASYDENRGRTQDLASWAFTLSSQDTAISATVSEHTWHNNASTNLSVDIGRGDIAPLAPSRLPAQLISVQSMWDAWIEARSPTQNEPPNTWGFDVTMECSDGICTPRTSTWAGLDSSSANGDEVVSHQSILHFDEQGSPTFLSEQTDPPEWQFPTLPPFQTTDITPEFPRNDLPAISWSTSLVVVLAALMIDRRRRPRQPARA